MNQLQINKALALGKCTFPAGTNQKRFAQQMNSIALNKPETDITEKQANYLDLMFHRYRKQIPQSHKRWCNCDDAKAAREQIDSGVAWRKMDGGSMGEFDWLKEDKKS